MKHLYFIRAATAKHCWDIYDANTDVWVFGDVAGYRYMRSCLRRAQGSSRNLRLHKFDPRSHSMRVIVVPAARIPMRAPRLKAIERIVFIESRPEMELVIYGNRAGYDRLSAAFERMIAGGSDGPHDHEHVDDNLLVPRSVYLNIRGPLSRWSRSRLGSYAQMVYQRQPTHLPPGIEYLTAEVWPYEEINPRRSRALSLR
ncbi:MAG TPA: hypothetical protein VGM03_17045 [Phycisphaerae bacterium]|jgi:hypothetical protein